MSEYETVFRLIRERDEARAEVERLRDLVQTVSEAHKIPWGSPVDVALHVVNAVGNARAEMAVLRAEIERLRDEVCRLEADRDMACECPPEDCECPGCSLARSLYRGGEK